MWYNLCRSILFCLDPEYTHHVTLKYLKEFYKNTKGSVLHKNPVNCFGITFPNALGLAAGLDKNAECIAAWNALGFGFVEVGTVTPKPQAGNPKPRLFRLPKDKAIINRMGFNNKGVDYLVNQVKAYRGHCPLGINIGKNKDTPLEKSYEDYVRCFQKVYSFADYITVNLSSPNTPGLKSLQHGDQLKTILIPLIEERKRLADTTQKQVPILVKISPDLTIEEVKQIADSLVANHIDGVIATNTTITRPDFLKTKINEEGGLSGEPLFDLSTLVVKTIYQQVGEALPIIAVGGISSVDQAKAKLQAGAKLVQLYTGLIYQGPGLVKKIVESL